MILVRPDLVAKNHHFGKLYLVSTLGTSNCNAAAAWSGNGYCDDENNHEICNFDGGDCCGTCANMDKCLDCQCFDDSPINYSCKFEHIDVSLEVTLFEHVPVDCQS